MTAPTPDEHYKGAQEVDEDGFPLPASVVAVPASVVAAEQRPATRPTVTVHRPSAEGQPPAREGAPDLPRRAPASGVPISSNPPAPAPVAPPAPTQAKAAPKVQVQGNPRTQAREPLPRTAPTPARSSAPAQPAETPREPQRASSTTPQPMQPVAPGTGAQQLLTKLADNRPVAKAIPQTGWRKAIYDLSNGRINPGPNSVEEAMNALLREVQAPLLGGGVRNMLIWSQKGGVGKTTLTTGIGTVLAMNRQDKVLALDVNSDGGSLAVRVEHTSQKTILDLRDALRCGYVAPADFDQFVNKSHRLDSIVMPPGMKSDDPLTGDDYLNIAEALSLKYPYRLTLTDCGTNLSDSVMDGALRVCHQLIVVTTTVMDEATVTAGGLDALALKGYGDLVRNAITVIVEKAPRDSNVNIQRKIDSTAETIRQHFESVTGSVVVAPYDPRIRIGDIFDPQMISEESRMAHLQIAARIITNLNAATQEQL